MNDLAAIDVQHRHGAGEQPAERAFRFGPHVHLALTTCSGGFASLAIPALREPLLLWIASGSVAAIMGPVDGTRHSIVLRQGDILLSATPQPVQLSRLAGDAVPLKMVRMHVGLPLLACAVEHVHHKPLTGFALRDATGRPDDTVKSLLEVLYAVLKRPARPCAYFVEGVTQALVAHLVRRYAGCGPRLAVLQGLPPHKLERCLRAMREALDEPFNLKHLAQQAGLSVFHFSRSFKLATGLSPSRYFVQLRMEEAKRLLCETAQPVLHVALALGYRSSSHFAQVFRELTGVSPSAYRASLAGHHHWTRSLTLHAFSPAGGAVR